MTKHSIAATIFNAYTTTAYSKSNINSVKSNVANNANQLLYTEMKENEYAKNIRITTVKINCSAD
jgi:hypothetical protein